MNLSTAKWEKIDELLMVHKNVYFVR